MQNANAAANAATINDFLITIGGDVSLRHIAYKFVHYLSTLEEKESRNIPDAIFLSYVLAVINVAFDHCGLAVIFGSDCLDCRCQRAARAAPSSPEVHKNRFAVGEDLREILVSCYLFHNQ